MSYRDLRNFTEMMRALGYPRLISVDNFRTPNFELVADVLFWMVKRYDPDTGISDAIETEDDRVEFLTTVTQAMAAKAKIKLNAKRLYAADGHAVKELLKISTMLYRASRVESVPEPDVAEPTHLPTQLKNIKGARALATDITERGARLFDYLGKEQDVRQERARALRFLDAISGNLENASEHDFVEKSVRELIEALKDNIENMKKQSKELEADEKGMDAKIKRKQQDLERSEKRLKNLQNVRPAFMDEYEKLEGELKRHYEVYLERFRNLDYLEHELDKLNKSESEKQAENDRQLKRMQKRLRDEELRLIRDGGKGLDEHLNEETSSKANQNFTDADRPAKAGASGPRREDRHREQGGDAVNGSMVPPNSDSEESESVTDDDEMSHDSESAESEEVSLASGSGSGSGSELIEEDDEGSEMSRSEDHDGLDDQSGDEDEDDF